MSDHAREETTCPATEGSIKVLGPAYPGMSQSCPLHGSLASPSNTYIHCEDCNSSPKGKFLSGTLPALQIPLYVTDLVVFWTTGLRVDSGWL